MHYQLTNNDPLQSVPTFVPPVHSTATLHEDLSHVTVTVNASNEEEVGQPIEINSKKLKLGGKIAFKINLISNI